jgi:hypothetical protein
MKNYLNQKNNFSPDNSSAVTCIAMALENMNPAIPKQPEDLFIEKYADYMIEVFKKVYPEAMSILGFLNVERPEGQQKELNNVPKN